MDSWAGIVAPARTPPAIVKRLNRELRRIIDYPDVRLRSKARLSVRRSATRASAHVFISRIHPGLLGEPVAFAGGSR
jgi:tripartite-type tricarboxylate transporter receptor subunit TctC